MLGAIKAPYYLGWAAGLGGPEPPLSNKGNGNHFIGVKMSVSKTQKGGVKWKSK